MDDQQQYLEAGRRAIRQEIEGLEALVIILNDNFNKAVSKIIHATSKVVITGIGKSGHIAAKAAATFCSTGSPSVFLHPAEASHGDLGLLVPGDVLIALSNSGESPEFGNVIKYCRERCITIIAITGKPYSTLGEAADIVLTLPHVDEACPLNLAPTTSTTTMLALMDALAVACMNARKFDRQAFSEYHPGGKIGRKLVKVSEVMHVGQALPLIDTSAKLNEAVLEMTRARFGCVGIIDNLGRLVGVFTDGDLRRHFSVENLHQPINKLMHPMPQRVSPNTTIDELTRLFSTRRIPSAFICEEEKPIGIIHIHDLIQMGYV